MHEASFLKFFGGNIQETTEAPYAPTDAPLAFSGLAAPRKTRSKHALPTVQPINFDQTSNPHGIISGNLVKAKQPRGGWNEIYQRYHPPAAGKLPNLTARWKREAFRVPASVQMEGKLLGTGLAGLAFLQEKKIVTRLIPFSPQRLEAFFSRIIVLLRLPQKLCPATLHHVGSLMVLA